MIIGIDGNEANGSNRVGVNIWAFEILRNLYALVTLSDTDEVVVYLSSAVRTDLPKPTRNWSYRVIGPRGLWTRWRFPLELFLSKPVPDVVLSLSHYAPKFSPCPRVISIMDLSFLSFPDAFTRAARWQLVDWTREAVRHASHIVTISQFNKREIIRAYGCNPKDITVVYPGVSEPFIGFKNKSISNQQQTVRNTREKFGITGRYLLFVGTIQPKKNIGRLIEAFRLVQQKLSGIQLVLAGKAWHQFGNVEGLDTRGSKGINVLGYVPDGDLPALVAGADCVVLPSVYEGFGIPAIEAMSVGTIVAASTVTSLPEVVGDAGVLFNPYEVKSIADALGTVLSMTEKERKRLSKRGMIQSQKFNWTQSAKMVLGVLKSER